MAALTQIYFDWPTGISDGYSWLGNNACNQYSTGGYALSVTAGGNKYVVHCTYGTNGHITLTATTTCPAETIPDYNSGYCVPYLNSTTYLDALRTAMASVIASTAPPAPVGGGGGSTGSTTSNYALPEMTIAEGTLIGMAIALAWAGAWGFRNIAKAFLRSESEHEE